MQHFEALHTKVGSPHPCAHLCLLLVSTSLSCEHRWYMTRGILQTRDEQTNRRIFPRETPKKVMSKNGIRTVSKLSSIELRVLETWMVPMKKRTGKGAGQTQCRCWSSAAREGLQKRDSYDGLALTNLRSTWHGMVYARSPWTHLVCTLRLRLLSSFLNLCEPRRCPLRRKIRYLNRLQRQAQNSFLFPPIHCL